MFASGSNANPEAKFSGTAIEQLQEIQQNYYQPYTAVSCIRNSAKNSESGTTLFEFARLLQTESESQKDREKFQVPNLTITQALNTPGNISQYRVSWIALPQALFTADTFGVILVDPQGPVNFTNCTTCTLGAGWGSSQIALSNTADYQIISSMTNFPSPSDINSVNDDVAGLAWQDFPAFINISSLLYPQQCVQISPN